MSDIFTEVEEDLRRERLKKVWRRFGPYIIATAVVIVFGTGGWRAYEAWSASRAAQSGDAFLAALEQIEAGDVAGAQAALAEVEAGATGGYPILARFTTAGLLAANGDTQAAIDAFDALSVDNAIPFRLQTLARLRAGYLLVDGGDLDAVRSRVESLAEGETPFRHSGREVMALAAFAAGDMEGARRWYEAIQLDVETPQDIRQRADVALAVIVSERGLPTTGAGASDDQVDSRAAEGTGG